MLKEGRESTSRRDSAKGVGECERLVESMRGWWRV